MTSLIKLKIIHKVGSAKSIPWDLLYLIKDEDLHLRKRLFKYHLVVLDDATIKEALKEFEFELMETHGMTRSETYSDYLSPKTKLEELVSLSGFNLLVPLLPAGKKAGKKNLRYLTSKKFRRSVKESASSYAVTSGKNPALCMPKVMISAGEKLEGHPCTNCANLHKKILDDTACSLGSVQCLSSILMGKGSDFNEQLEDTEGGK